MHPHDGPPSPAATSRSHATRQASHRVQFRRGLTLTLMTLFVPGSAQLVTGHRRTGLVAIRIWLTCLVAAAVLGLLALTSRSAILDLATNPRVLTIGRWLLIAGAVAWVALLLDAWRLAQPLRMARNHRLLMTGMNAGLCFVLAGAMFFAAHLVSVQNGFIGTVFAAQTTTPPHEGRYNVLLMGSDSGSDREGMRPDSMTVASVDAESGQTVLIGLPRNLEDVPFPKDSFMKKAFPDTFDCDGCYLNAVNTWANDHAAELGAGKQPGIRATMDAISEITGLDLNYYALVNMRGFSKLVDAVGGVRMNVRERTSIGGITEPIQGWIEPGEQTLSGSQALWYARSRKLNNDFSRMGRQKCVLNAMLQDLSPQKVLLKSQAIARSSAAMLDTDIPAADLNVFMDLALKSRGQKVRTVSLVPPQIYTGNPDYPKVRRMVADAVRAASGGEEQPRDRPSPRLTTTHLPEVTAAPTTPDPSPATAATKDPGKANQSSDLASAC